ncbi:hypothetical protein M3Y95_00434700 [Aphelenchoides besseyi]|nr:hypothetical protein M3Y95_00434700 [Aphelenchoides besseyi]
MSNALNVEPRFLAVDTIRFEQDKSLIYVTNISSVRQYIKFTSTHSQSFVINYIDKLEAGQTMTAEIQHLNINYQLGNEEVDIYVYYSKVQNENLRLKHDGRHKIIIRLIGPPIVKRPNPGAVKLLGPGIQFAAPEANPKITTIQSKKVVERKDNAGKAVVEFKATEKPKNTITHEDEMNEL